MARWIDNAAGGTSQRLHPGPATILERSSKPTVVTMHPSEVAEPGFAPSPLLVQRDTRSMRFFLSPDKENLSTVPGSALAKCGGGFTDRAPRPRRVRPAAWDSRAREVSRFRPKTNGHARFRSHARGCRPSRAIRPGATWPARTGVRPR